MTDSPKPGKTRLRRLFEALSFCVLLLALLTYASAVLKPKRTANMTGGGWESYLSLPKDSLDVLFVGTSHSYTGVDPAALWRRRGIVSFVLAGPNQTMRLTDYWLHDALKTQHPKVVVVEVLAMTYGEDVYNPGHQQINVHYMPLSLNRIAAALLATPNGRRTEVLVELWAYHDRWKDLEPADYDLKGKRAGYEYLKGFVPMTLSNTEPIDSKPARLKPLAPRTQKVLAYNMPALRHIADDCRRRDIQLVLLLTPTAPPARYTAAFASVAKTLRKDFPGVQVLDLSGPGAVPALSYAKDFYDDGHVTYRGAEKIAVPLADFLAATCEVPDRSHESAYASWKQDAKKRDAYIAKRLKTVPKSKASTTTPSASREPTAAADETSD